VVSREEAKGGEGTWAQRKAISLEEIPFVGVGGCFFSYSEINKNGNDLNFVFFSGFHTQIHR